MSSIMVVIVGAGPSGLATSACLNRLSVPNIVLEREDCCASLWKNRSYDRLKLHLAKQFCQLPHMPFPFTTSTFVSRKDFISYLDNYASHFHVNPRYCRSVESASYLDGKWRIVAKKKTKNIASTDEVEEEEVYISEFLVVATGENSEGFMPKVAGLENFEGDVLHSNNYKSGSSFVGQNVLVVGSGNSGMEIAYDLSNWAARTSIAARSPVHVLTKEMVYLGMFLLKLLPCAAVDTLITKLSNWMYGDISSYGLQRQKKGPFYLKAATGRSPVIDVGTMGRIKEGTIKVLPAISHVRDRDVVFANGKTHIFDAIIFATGYRPTVRYWLKGGDDLFNEDGMPKSSIGKPWKGKNGLYCAGFGKNGLFGISADAKNIANDIKSVLTSPE